MYVLIPSVPERKERLQFAIDCVKRSICNQPIEVVTKINNYEGFVKPMLEMLDGVNDLVLFIGDDTETTPFAIQRLYDAYCANFKNNDGICVPCNGKNDLGEKVGSHALMHSKTWKDVLHPGYFHNFCDREWTDIMKYRGKYCYVKDALIVHHHMEYEPIHKDATYRIGELSSTKDGELYQYRKKHGFFRSIYPKDE